MIESCAGCLYDLGGGRDNCCLGVAAECRDGGGYEAWTDMHKYDDDVQIAPVVTLEDVMEDMQKNNKVLPAPKDEEETAE